MKRLSPLIALLFAVVFYGAAFAQNPAYTDQVLQLPSPSGVEHNIYRYEYANAMSSAGQGIPYWAESSLVTPANDAIGMLNSNKPARNQSAYNVPFENTSEDVKIRYGNCPGGLPGVACFTIDSYYNMSSHWVYTWQKATVWIKPDVGGSVWTSTSLRLAIAHEMMHAYGLNDQYIVSGGSVSCNGNVSSLMDGFGTNGSGQRYHCDLSSVTMTSWDTARWNEYKISGYYTYDYANIWGDGTVISYWIDNAWNDYKFRAQWQWKNGSTWTPFADSEHINYNGSHVTVSGAGSWRINAWLNPGFYGVHNVYVRACGRPVYNHTDLGGWVCGPQVFYPY